MATYNSQYFDCVLCKFLQRECKVLLRIVMLNFHKLQAEFGSYGPGYNASLRESSEHLGTNAQGETLWNLASVFKGLPKWIDYTWKSNV